MFFHYSAVVSGVEDGEGVVREGDHVAPELEVEGVEGGWDWICCGGCGEGAGGEVTGEGFGGA